MKREAVKKWLWEHMHESIADTIEALNVKLTGHYRYYGIDIVNIYKIRTVVERDINHIKDNLCLAGRRTQNKKTLHADLILAGITQLITVVLADKINHHEYIRSVKPLIA